MISVGCQNDVCLLYLSLISINWCLIDILLLISINVHELMSNQHSHKILSWRHQHTLIWCSLVDVDQVFQSGMFIQCYIDIPVWYLFDVKLIVFAHWVVLSSYGIRVCSGKSSRTVILHSFSYKTLFVC